MNIGLAQLNFTVGDIDYNKELIKKTIFENRNRTMIIFPELCVTGYPPMDLINREDFMSKQREAVEEIVLETKKYDVAAVIGYIGYHNSKKYNSLAVVYRGKKIFTYDKKLLPTYDVFDEKRD